MRELSAIFAALFLTLGWFSLLAAHRTNATRHCSFANDITWKCRDKYSHHPQHWCARCRSAVVVAAYDLGTLTEGTP